MIKVAAVVPPASMNLGNDFFSLGGIEAFKQTFNNVEMQLHYIEFFDSGENGFGSGKTPFFTEATLSWIKESSDLVVLFAGCALHTGLKHLFKPLIDTGKPFIGWGLSPTQYSQSDISFAKEIADKSLALITRDDIIYQMVGEYPNLISGMDGGWWMGDSYVRPEKTLEYLIVNIEKGGQVDPKECENAVNILRNQTNSPIYIISNNCERQYHYHSSNSFLVTSAKHLYTTLANSSYVVTTRAHTSICCLTNGVPLEYLGVWDNRVKGLMDTVGVDLTSDNMNPEEIMQTVKYKKDEFIKKIRNTVDISSL